LPEGNIFPPAAIAHSLNMSRASAKITITLAYGYKAPFTVSSYAFRTQEWLNLAREYMSCACARLRP
jgi:hypothetical protein